MNILENVDTISKKTSLYHLWIFFMWFWVICGSFYLTLPLLKASFAQSLLYIANSCKHIFSENKLWGVFFSLRSLVCQKLRQEVGSYKPCFLILYFPASPVWISGRWGLGTVKPFRNIPSNFRDNLKKMTILPSTDIF